MFFHHFLDELFQHRNCVVQLFGGKTNGNLHRFIRFVLDTHKKAFLVTFYMCACVLIILHAMYLGPNYARC